MRPVSTVDGEGFVSLMEVVEPCYSVPCRRTIMNFNRSEIFIDEAAK